MITCKLTPTDWQCSLDDCPPGLFTYQYGGDHNAIGFKSEYGAKDGGGYEVEAFNDAGEYLAGDPGLVQPAEVTWGEE